MLALFALIPMLFCAPHGGQFTPPLDDPDLPEVLKGVVAEPGLGPELPFEAYRWEWWLDFNQEELLDLRRRMPARARLAGTGTYEAVTADDRASTVLPALVAALRKRPPVAGQEVRRDINNRDVRAAAVLALGRLGSADAVPYIQIVAESDPDLFVRLFAVLALGFSGRSEAVEDLVRLYRDPHEPEQIRTFAAAGLGLIGNTQAVDTLLTGLGEKALADMNNQLRAATIYAAGVCGNPTLGVALRALDGTWLFQKEPDVRALAAVSLGRIDDPASVPFLLKLITDPDNQVRRSAASALQASSARLDKASIETMIEQYERDADQNTRLNLLRALGSARLPESRAFLRQALTTSTYEYRPHVALALAFDGDPGNAPVLLASLADQKDLSVVSALTFSLGMLQAGSATDPLLARFDAQSEASARGYLCIALGLIDPPQPELAARFSTLALTGHDVELTRSALIGLGLLGARGEIDKLAAALPSVKGVMARAALVHGLGLVGDRKTLKPLLDVLKDDSQTTYVRAYTLQAIGEISDPREISQCWRLSSHVELNHDIGFLFDLYRVL
ncbi:MAG TPA: HEAT repeat domain-containing protein [Planctomycetota bacterium]|nr:HEAT repeat domain-containing protein [Planctomycetota bacterium]